MVTGRGRKANKRMGSTEIDNLSSKYLKSLEGANKKPRKVLGKGFDEILKGEIKNVKKIIKNPEHS